MNRTSWIEAKKIWLFPVGIYMLLSVASILVFTRVTTVYQLDGLELDTGEQILTFTLYTGFLVTWYIVKSRYERYKGVRVRKSIRLFGMFFLIVYMVYGLSLLHELILTLS